MHIAICDDDELYCIQILRLLMLYASSHKSMNLSFSIFSKPADLLQASEQANGFDVYILDIVMPEMDGIELGLTLRSQGYNGNIIYLTSSTEFAVDSYKAEASNYILKPIDKDTFLNAIDKVLSAAFNKKNGSIIVKTKECSIRLSFDSILYVELKRRTLCYHLANGNTVSSITLRVPFEEAIAPLLKDNRFFHCGKSLAINLDNITSIGTEEVTFKECHTAYFSKTICRSLRVEWSTH